MEEKYLKYLKIKTPKNYSNGLKTLGIRVNFNFFDKNIDEIDFFLKTIDSNFKFEKNEKTHLKSFVQFLSLDTNEYIVFNRKENEKTSKKTEKTAINFTKEYYIKKGYSVISVETKNLGWDLEVRKNGEISFLEVKGLNKNFNSIYLSKNEYEKLKKHKEYKICIVYNCGSSLRNRKIIILSLNKYNKLMCENDNEHILTEVLSAIVSKPKL